MQIISILVFSILTLFTTRDKEKTEKIDLSYNVNNYKQIRIHNFRGNVTIKAYSGNSLQISGSRLITSKTDSGLEEGFSKVKLNTTLIDGEFIVFINAPDKHFKIDKEGNSHYESDDWNNWDKDKIKEPDYSFEYTLEVKIPADKVLYAATHWKDIDVSGMKNDLTVKNHHGNVMVKTTSENLVVKSHHGDLVVENNSRITKKGIFKTHHGDITTSFAGLSANVSMDTYHGDLYTDYEYSVKPMLINVSENSAQKAKYKYKAKTNVIIGNGEGEIQYKTHHGNIFIKKLNNNG